MAHIPSAGMDKRGLNLRWAAHPGGNNMRRDSWILFALVLRFTPSTTTCRMIHRWAQGLIKGCQVRTVPVG
jgi:hypothetical protein